MPAKGGRPPTRSDRWVALFTLLYLTATETHSKERFGELSLRQRVAHHADCSVNTVTNVVKEAKRRGLLTALPIGSRAIPLPRNYSGGVLTPFGWEALGPVTDDWRKHLGSDWEVVSTKRKTAMRLLGRELQEEAERQQRNAAAQRAAVKAQVTQFRSRP